LLPQFQGNKKKSEEKENSKENQRKSRLKTHQKPKGKKTHKLSPKPTRQKEFAHT
jgi:hypothetical protein